MTTSPTSFASTPARATASRIAIAPRSLAERSLNWPPNDPIGVRQALSVRPFAEPAPTRVVALAWRKSFPRHRVIGLLAEAIRACPLGAAVRTLE